MEFRELDYQTRALTALDAYLVALSAEKPRYDKVAALGFVLNKGIPRAVCS